MKSTIGSRFGVLWGIDFGLGAQFDDLTLKEKTNDLQ
jgi:hypothetical protein